MEVGAVGSQKFRGGKHELANKIARIGLAMVAGGGRYREPVALAA
jgi:hypothetical protein